MRPLVRRSLAVLIAALLAGVLIIAGVSAPAEAAPTKGSLSIVSVTDSNAPLGLLVQGQPFTVVVQVLDTNGQPTTLTKATQIVLEADGPGTLSGVTTATILRDGSGFTFRDLTYSAFANGVTLTARVLSGVALAPDSKKVDFVYSVVTKNATAGDPLNLQDSKCGAPTADVVNCGQLLLPHGANGRVTMYVGSCDGLGLCDAEPGNPQALVVTAVADIKDLSTPDPDDTLYSKTSPATLILACDKALCRDTANGVPHLRVVYTLDNAGALDTFADPCPSKGTLGPDPVCVDNSQSKRQNGDLYSYVLFDYDLRLSHP
jgi:hypothetical protein